MDNFENYLFDKIVELKGYIKETEENFSSVSEDINSSVLYSLNNALAEVVEIFSVYNQNYKFDFDR